MAFYHVRLVDNANQWCVAEGSAMLLLSVQYANRLHTVLLQYGFGLEHDVV
jgi:uncharacterized membrane protein